MVKITHHTPSLRVLLNFTQILQRLVAKLFWGDGHGYLCLKRLWHVVIIQSLLALCEHTSVTVIAGMRIG